MGIEKLFVEKENFNNYVLYESFFNDFEQKLKQLLSKGWT